MAVAAPPCLRGEHARCGRAGVRCGAEVRAGPRCDQQGTRAAPLTHRCMRSLLMRGQQSASTGALAGRGGRRRGRGGRRGGGQRRQCWSPRQRFCARTVAARGQHGLERRWRWQQRSEGAPGNVARVARGHGAEQAQQRGCRGRAVRQEPGAVGRVRASRVAAAVVHGPGCARRRTRRCAALVDWSSRRSSTSAARAPTVRQAADVAPPAKPTAAIVRPRRMRRRARRVKRRWRKIAAAWNAEKPCAARADPGRCPCPSAAYGTRLATLRGCLLCAVRLRRRRRALRGGWCLATTRSSRPSAAAAAAGLRLAPGRRRRGMQVRRAPAQLGVARQDERSS